MQLIELAIVISCIVFLYYLKTIYISQMLVKEGFVSGKKYKVRKDSPNVSVVLLEKLNTLLEDLRNIPDDDYRLEKLRNTRVTIHESDPTKKGNSYTISKQEIHMCLRGEDNVSFTDINTLKFVFLHELAHVVNSSYGHDKDFWETFEFLLNKSIEIGHYNAVDYDAHHKKYCNIEITSSPLF